MKNCVVMFMVAVVLNNFMYAEVKASQDEKQVVNRDGVFYEKFSNKPYTGKGIFFEDDTVAKINLLNGKLNGTALVYNKESGNLGSEITFKDNKRDGFYKTYNERGEPTSEVIYRDNKACDGWDKQLEQNLIYKDCKKNGIEIDYKDKKWIKVYWENGVMTKTEPRD